LVRIPSPTRASLDGVPGDGGSVLTILHIAFVGGMRSAIVRRSREVESAASTPSYSSSSSSSSPPFPIMELAIVIAVIIAVVMVVVVRFRSLVTIVYE
jgi:hypothetical protein